MGKGAANTLSSTQSSQLADSSALVNLAQNQSSQAGQIFNTSFPDFSQASQFYQNLASGDPFSIARAVAPIAESSDASAAAAKGNILRTGPAGGEKNLALEQVDVNRGAQVGGAASSGYLNAQNSLASLGQAGIGQSQSGAGLGISGLNSATSGFNNVGNQAIQQKGQTLGAIGSLAGDATSVATGGIAGKGGKSSGGGSGSNWTSALSPTIPETGLLPLSSMPNYAFP